MKWNKLFLITQDNKYNKGLNRMKWGETGFNFENKVKQDIIR